MTEHLNAQLRLSIAQKSVAGVKSVNEDCIGICVPEGNALTNKGITAIIADGVSAAEAGKEASEASVQGFISDYYSTPDSWQTKTSAHKVLTALNRWLYSQSQGYRRAGKGFVCTLSALILKSRVGYLFHVGDTRIYRLRGDDFEQLTRDHVADVGNGRQYLARAMGMDLNLDIDFRKVELEVDDVFLLSSDGVHDFLTTADIVATVRQYPDDLETATERLVQQALDNSSGDNLSVQLLKIEQLPDTSSVDDVYTRLTALPFAPYLQPGMKLDGLLIETEMHASNRSEVYLVRDLSSEQRHVMKVASRNFDDDPAYIERFVMEEWIGRRIRNPYVIKISDTPEKRSCLYYLTEHVDGISLDQWMQNNPRPGLETLYPMIDQICKGVTSLHRLETLHQDLKPGNILYDRDQQIKIIDFGSCRVGGLGEIDTALERDFALGTMHYSAPEYRLDRKAGVQADFFSIGVICYRLICGKLPYGEKYANAKTLKDFYKLEYTPAYQHNPLIPKWVDGALKKMLQIQPEARYQELSEFVYDLQHPNPKFAGSEYQPLVERYPLRSWQLIAGLSLLANVFLLYLLLK